MSRNVTAGARIFAERSGTSQAKIRREHAASGLEVSAGAVGCGVKGSVSRMTKRRIQARLEAGAAGKDDLALWQSRRT